MHLIIGILVYSVFIFIEFIHEYSHTRRSNGAWKTKFLEDSDLQSSVKQTKEVFDKVSRQIQSIISQGSVYSPDFHTKISEAKYKFEDSLRQYHDLIQIEDIPSETGKIWEYLGLCKDQSQQVLNEIDNVISEISTASHFSIENSNYLHSRIESSKDEIIAIMNSDIIPSASEITKISSDIYKSDGMMFRIHDGIIPILLFALCFASLSWKLIEFLPIQLL